MGAKAIASVPGQDCTAEWKTLVLFPPGAPDQKRCTAIKKYCAKGMLVIDCTSSLFCPRPETRILNVGEGQAPKC